MNYIARPIEGSIIDLPKDPRVRLKWVTNTPGGLGKPIQKQPQPPPPDEKPRDLGEERHHELLGALKGIKVSQTANLETSVAEALKQNRDWR